MMNKRFFRSLAIIYVLLAVTTVWAALNTTTYWLGNTYPGGLTPSKFVQLNMEEIAVFKDGKVVASCQWDEGGHATSFYKDGDALGLGAGSPHSWGGSAITYDDKYLFVAVQDRYLSGSDPAWYGVSRSNLDGSPSTFTNAKGQGAIKIVCFIYTARKETQPQGGKPIPGLAVQGNDLFIADAAFSKIRVYDKELMTPKREFPLVPSGAVPGKMIFDGQGRLWVSQYDSVAAKWFVCQYETSGTPTGKKITDIALPSALCLDRNGKLMIADISRSRQQIRWYDITATPAVVDSFGTSVFSGANPGRIEPGRFAGITGVGVDSSGNLYVSENGIGPWQNNHFGAKLWKFNASRQYQWVLDGLMFMDCAAADPGADTNVYSRGSKITLNYALPTVGGVVHPSWRHAGRLVDPFTYPDDPRIVWKNQLGSEIIRINNRLFQATFENDNTVTIYRLVGDLSIPAVMFHAAPAASYPPNNPYGRVDGGSWKACLWVDKNGNGQFESAEWDTIYGLYSMNIIRSSFVDPQGTVWLGQGQNNPRISKFPLDSINSHGVPCYSRFSRTYIQAPASISTLGRIRYIPQLDRMYILCHSPARPQEIWSMAGREIRRYDHWSTTRDSIFAVPVIYKYTNNRGADFQPACMDVDESGDYLFVGYDWGSDDAHNRGEVVVYSGKDGALVGKLNHAQSPQIGNNSGCLDFASAVRAHKRPDGTYVVFVEDDAYAKVIYYQWNPSGTTRNISAKSTAGLLRPWCQAVLGGVRMENPFSLPAKVSITNAAGRLVAVSTLPESKGLHIKHLSSGGILVVTIDGNGHRLSRRLVVP